jgi:hypothetical protein
MVTNYLRIATRRFLDYCLFGNTIQVKGTELHFKEEIIKSPEFRPVFFLSTGRTGTAFFTELLAHSSSVKVFHSPSSLLCDAKSELIEQGRVAYEMYRRFGLEDETVNRLSAQIFMAARETLLYKSYLHRKCYIETNNRVTFLAPAIKSYIPHARFVHLYRHPGEFIRSGVRRHYYRGEDAHQIGMIRPIEESTKAVKWETYGDVEKVAWLWNETNAFIDDFVQTIDAKECFRFNFNDLSVDNVRKLLEFLDVNDVKDGTIASLIPRPVNVQKSGDFPAYEQWSEVDKAAVRRLCGERAERYGYTL